MIIKRLGLGLRCLLGGQPQFHHLLACVSVQSLFSSINGANNSYSTGLLWRLSEKVTGVPSAS